jgi:hypothetical protein
LTVRQTNLIAHAMIRHTAARRNEKSAQRSASNRDHRLNRRKLA